MGPKLKEIQKNSLFLKPEQIMLTFLEVIVYFKKFLVGKNNLLQEQKQLFKIWNTKPHHTSMSCVSRAKF